MAANDIIIFDDGIAIPGSKRYKVLGQGRAGGIKVGEFCIRTLGNTSGYAVTAWTSGLAASAIKPSVGTDYIVGLAACTSTETASANGIVDVIPNMAGMTYLVDPLVTATWDTQAEYDALVGARIKLNYAATTGKMTALAVDSIYGGAVVEPLDITLHPGKVRFSLRRALSPLS